jgi:phosphoribosylformimino-5-aminoimidazole carboxamide ribotide isomerase
MPLPFSIVPVMDLKGGSVVHARAGERASYRPIETPLSPSAAPADVLTGLRSLKTFRRLYIADLDAIEGKGDHGDAIAALLERFPDLEIWLDAGFASAEAAAASAGPRLRPVLGSESIAADAATAKSFARLAEKSCPLSLDYRGDRFLGPTALERTPALWPPDVIVMTLARVGTGQGPDRERLARVQALAGPRRVWAAGGVRGVEDLERLAAMGVAGALVATALHDGRLPRAALAAFD